MPPRINNERLRLLRHMETLLDHLSTLDEQSVKEYRAAKAHLELIDAGGTDQRYAAIRSSKKGIWEVLGDEKQWLFKNEIADKLIRGGFKVEDPHTGPYLIVQNVTKHVQRGNLQQASDGRVGLLEWEKY